MFFTTKDTQVSTLNKNTLISKEHWLIGLAINQYTNIPTIYIEGLDQNSGVACLHKCTLVQIPNGDYLVQLTKNIEAVDLSQCVLKTYLVSHVLAVPLVANYEERLMNEVASYEGDTGIFGISQFKPQKWGFEQLRLIGLEVDENEFRPQTTCCLLL